MKPFLKWPGGKRWIVPHLKRILAGNVFRRYFEPFLGGGAIFFAIQPGFAIISDINEDLINTYKQVRDRPLHLIESVRRIPVDAISYLAIRENEPECSFERAVRFLYLNRTSFSGMYRLNRMGKFNVPFGGGHRTPETLWKDNVLFEASKMLKNVTILTCDFQESLQLAGTGDLVFCDPTYTSTHNNNGFIRYNERNFAWADQERLALACEEAARRGATVVISNAFHREIAVLYPSAETITLDRKSLLCPVSSKRQTVKEYLFFLRPPGIELDEEGKSTKDCEITRVDYWSIDV